MRLGFIGTGKIASSVITGICGSSIKYSKIFNKRLPKVILAITVKWQIKINKDQ